MNKTIIININGTIFHIEEDAYELLRSYMSEVKRHFAYSPDSDEIVTDIENRLAEMFSDRLTIENKQVIILQDVQEITAQMGTVADFEITEEEAEYFPKMGKKLFRDTEDRIIGGVCSGIGHYLEIEARWVRLFMLLIVLLGGSGIMIYAILWIVMPPAKTRTDKMAMKGEAINLQNFKKTFDEELENVRQGVTRVHHEARPALNSLGNTLVTLFKVFLKIVGILVIFIEAMVLLGLIIGLIVVLGLWNTGELGPLPHIVDPEYRSILAIGIFLALSVPLISLLLLEIRLLFNRKVIGKTGAFFMLILWLAGLGTSVYYGARTGLQFSNEASFSQLTDIKPMPVYYLKLSSDKYLTHQDSLDFNVSPNHFKGRTIINTSNHNMGFLKHIDLVIEPADINKPSLTQEFRSKGPNFEQALKSAQMINYRFKQVDSVLYFDPSLDIGKNSMFRDQELKMVLQIPQNTRLIIDQRLNRYIRGYNLWDCIAKDAGNQANSEWTMTPGGMKCNRDSLMIKNEDPATDQP